MLKFSRYFLAIGVILATAWSVLADEPQPAAPTLKITNERICPGTISPYQYGQFIEYLCALTPSMFSEKLFDGSFEGVPAVQVRVPQGDRPRRTAVVSRRRRPTAASSSSTKPTPSTAKSRNASVRSRAIPPRWAFRKAACT